MNSHNKKPCQQQTLVEVFPPIATHQIIMVHPIFPWNKAHLRSVTVEPTLTEDGVFTATYSDCNRDIFLSDLESAEEYLGYKIPQPKYIGQLFIRKDRDVYAYTICKECGHIECSRIEVTFQGPFDIVNGSIKTTADLSCPKCGWTVEGAEINTEPSLDYTLAEDCDWAGK